MKHAQQDNITDRKEVLHSKLTHLGKSDCRRDLWANKLQKYNRVVSTRHAAVNM